MGRNESDHRNYYSLKITLTKSFQIMQHEAGGLRGVVVCGGVWWCVHCAGFAGESGGMGQFPRGATLSGRAVVSTLV